MLEFNGLRLGYSALVVRELFQQNGKHIQSVGLVYILDVTGVHNQTVQVACLDHLPKQFLITAVCKF